MNIVPSSISNLDRTLNMLNNLVEVWVEFGIACLIVFSRIAIRCKKIGIRNFRGDDYLCIVLLVRN
jgi:hypothetical protein